MITKLAAQNLLNNPDAELTDLERGLLEDIIKLYEPLDDGPYPDGIKFEKPLLDQHGVLIGYEPYEPNT